METKTKNKTGGIVVGNFNTARVSAENGIHYCCKGGINVVENSLQNGVNKVKRLPHHDQVKQSQKGSDFLGSDLSLLIDHIVNHHHHYVENTIPALMIYFDKLAIVHGESHPELTEIRNQIYEAAEVLTAHMKKEELVIFPYIKAMEESLLNGFPLSQPHFGHIDHPIQRMEREHQTEGDRFRYISTLSSGYTAPADSCQTYRVAYAMLEEFEQDLHSHIHLENTILFPKAKELYKLVHP